MAGLVRFRGEPIGRGLDVLYALLRAMVGVDLKDDGCGFAGLFIFRGKVAGFVRVKG